MDCPDVNKGHIDRHVSLSRRSLDATDCDDMFSRGDELFCEEANVKGSIEAREKAVGHVLEALEMAGSDGPTPVMYTVAPSTPVCAKCATSAGSR